MKKILPIIVAAQFFCTSVWFAGNAIVTDIAAEFHLSSQFLAHLTSAIQFGFISGTLFFALFNIADRFSPSIVFFVSSLIAGFFNLCISLENINPTEILLLRFLTGFFLAGIYPVGMKIASDYYQAGLEKSLGFLVGALVLGTAFPHLLKNFTMNFPWRYVVYGTTILSVLGGLSVFSFVPNGPYRKPAQKLDFVAMLDGFKHPKFRAAAFGYFGHMWELYTFWAFVPLMLVAHDAHNSESDLNVPLLSFVIIGLGSLACVFAGLLSQKFGAKKIATIALFSSCVCCLVSPLFLFTSSTTSFIAFLIFWGLAVIADSPLFSTLVAQNAPEKSRGTALTIVNCIGFSITIVSIQLINILSDKISAQYIYVFLALGPMFGLAALFKKEDKPA